MIHFLFLVPFLLLLQLKLSTSIKWEQCVTISTDHSEALQAWLIAAKLQGNTGAKLGFRGRSASKSLSKSYDLSKVSVIHIDHHSDINVPEKYIPHGSNWIQNHTILNQFASTADLASFQLSAVWGGLVDRIVWIKPNFRQKYIENRFIDETHLLYYNTSLNQFHLERYNNKNVDNNSNTLSRNRRRDELLIKKRRSSSMMQNATYQFNEIRIDHLLSALIKNISLSNRTEKKEVLNDADETIKYSYVKSSDYLNRLIKLMGLNNQKIGVEQHFILDIDLDYFIPEERYAGSPPWAYSKNRYAVNDRDKITNLFGKLTIEHCRDTILIECPNGKWADHSTCPVWLVLQEIQHYEWYGININNETRKLVSLECIQELTIIVKKVGNGPASEQMKCLANTVTMAEWMLFAKLLHDQPSTFFELLKEKEKDNNDGNMKKDDNINDYLRIAARGTKTLQPMVDELGQVLKFLLPAVPVVISIARSTDYWTPVSEYAAIEVAVLKMLQSVYGKDQLLKSEDDLNIRTCDSVEAFYGNNQSMKKMIYTFSVKELRHIVPNNATNASPMICTKNTKGATPNVDLINGMLRCSTKLVDQR